MLAGGRVASDRRCNPMVIAGFVVLADHHIIWEFPKIQGTLFWGPYNKDPTT